MENACSPQIYRQKYQLESRGILVTPVLAKTYWYNYTVRLPQVRQQFEQTLHQHFIAIMELVHEGVLSMEQLVQKMCHAPAELYNIERRGYLRPGYQADLVLVNPDHEWTVTADCVLSKCGWSPMEGQKFHSRVEKTFVNGDLVYSDNKVDESHRGQELRFKR